METKGVRTITLGFALLASAGAALASVTIDESGVGFVGKGDIQLLYDWNNAQLQEYAGSLQFRYATSGTASWTCEGKNPKGNVVTTQHDITTGISSSVAFDPRKNRQGQITGFNLGGFEGEDSTTTVAPGDCPPGNANWWQLPQLVGEITWAGSEEGTLQVSTGDGIWYDLVITY